MSKPIINGKKALSSKPKPKNLKGSFSMNLLDIPSGVQAELDAKGLEGRWISYKQYAENYGHKNGWVVFKAETKSLPEGLIFGNNPDGIIRRGDLVLAVRTKDQCNEHREILAEKARISSRYSKAKAAELRQMVKEHSLDAEVFEGYEENG